MNNGDMPANSTSLEISDRYEEGHYDRVALGLTKREHLQCLAMAALLSNPAVMDFTRFENVAAGSLGGQLLTKVANVHVEAMLKSMENTDET